MRVVRGLGCRIFLCLGLLLTLGAAPAAADVVTIVHKGGEAPMPLDFCRAFNALQDNSLLDQLDEELKSFLSLLQAETADINGAFEIDDSGETLQVYLEGNGIRDASNELGIIAEILTNPSAYPGDGPISHTTLQAKWEANEEQIAEDLGFNLNVVLGALAPELKVIFLGYLMLGDGDFNLISPLPCPVDGPPPCEEGGSEGECCNNAEDPIIVDGTGSFGFVGAVFALVSDILEEELGFPLENPNISKSDYQSAPELLVNADADGDSFTNLCEARYFARTPCNSKRGGPSDPNIDYITAALDASLIPNGCFVDVGRCDFDLSGDLVVPPVTASGVGRGRIDSHFNSTISTARRELTVFHTATFPTRASINIGAPGENGIPFIGLGNGTLPIERRLTQTDLFFMREYPTYVSILRNPPADGENDPPEAEDLRGPIVCNLGTNAEGPRIMCEGDLLQSSVVPPVTSEPERSGGYMIYILPNQNNTLHGTLYTDLPGPQAAQLYRGAAGTNGTLIADFGKPQARNGFTFSTNLTNDEADAALAGELYLIVTSSANPGGHMRGQLDCILIGGEGEGEGDTEGEGEGDTEGEGEGEGDTEGEGEGDTEGEGEGDTEGEGEGSTEGEGANEGESSTHTADQDGNNLISLSELLRVIQFFNSEGLSCDLPPSDPPTEDGYRPGPGDQSCTPHASDYNPQDWEISLSELLRIIQFFNSQGYNFCPDNDPPTEDGFCPGLA